MAPVTRKCITITIGTVVIIGVALGTGLGLARFTGSLNDNPSQGGGQSGGQGIQGDLTYYAPGLGACGRYNTANDKICAISHITYDAYANGPNPNTNPLCGKQIRASRNGKSVVVTVVDRCEGCKANDIDLSPAAFNQLAKAAEGRVPVTWSWMT
ncbi:MAG: hypothetical protein LQ339_008935 [Xanthoria mediterranea]|nr:MAG: hypothetical protein LQ339_008935 [Xanthoria mediterranea]